MKREDRIQTSVLVAGLLALAFVNPVQAGEFIAGIKAGVVDVEAPGFDPITTASLQLGYEFTDLLVLDVALEGEITRSLSDADGPGGDYSYENAGVFASLRSAGPIYVIARAGLVDIRLEQDSGSSSDSGTAYGLGLGFSTGVRWEIEWTTYDFEDDDINRVSFHLSF